MLTCPVLRRGVGIIIVELERRLDFWSGGSCLSTQLRMSGRDLDNRSYDHFIASFSLYDCQVTDMLLHVCHQLFMSLLRHSDGRARVLRGDASAPSRITYPPNSNSYTNSHLISEPHHDPARSFHCQPHFGIEWAGRLVEI